MPIFDRAETSISIHAPRVGSDRAGRISSPAEVIGISIHAPRVGSDVAVEAEEIKPVPFQSTLPVWGATLKAIHLRDVGFLISIHAPRVGSDAMQEAQTASFFEFQSTLPVWGATGVVDDDFPATD